MLFFVLRLFKLSVLTDWPLWGLQKGNMGGIWTIRGFGLNSEDTGCALSGMDYSRFCFNAWLDDLSSWCLVSGCVTRSSGSDIWFGPGVACPISQVLQEHLPLRKHTITFKQKKEHTSQASKEPRQWRALRRNKSRRNRRSQFPRGSRKHEQSHTHTRIEKKAENKASLSLMENTLT